jgi:hypothetical protein
MSESKSAIADPPFGAVKALPGGSLLRARNAKAVAIADRGVQLRLVADLCRLSRILSLNGSGRVGDRQDGD